MTRPRKITDAIRKAFVDAVLADVPSVDYATQIRDLAKAAAAATFEPDVQKVFKKRPDFFASTGHRLSTTYVYVSGDPEKLKKLFEKKGALADEVEGIEALSSAQDQKRTELAASVKAMIFQFSTVEAAAKGMPEFAKYLPKVETPPDRSLPVANVVAELNAAGWPKDKARIKPGKARPA